MVKDSDNDFLSGDGSRPVDGVPLVQIGAGTVGLELMELVRGSRRFSEGESQFSYVGIGDSSGLAKNREGFRKNYLEEVIELKKAGRRLEDVETEQVVELEGVEAFFREFDSGIFVDVTDAPGLDKLYREALEEGWAVVLANKIPLTEVDPGQFNWLKDAGIKYEATVGAGLPVISTLDSLERSGDEVKEVSAILSGSLSYILSRLEEGSSIDEAVIEARDKGFTEPNPVDDLVGKDVHRKSLILNRTIGGDLSLGDIDVSPLVPLEEERYPEDRLKSELEKFNSEFQAKLESARENGKRLRYVASVRRSSASVGLEEVEADSSLAMGPGTANVIDIKSENYESPSLVIQGPGAGPKVTAGGVFSEMKGLVETGQV